MLSCLLSQHFDLSFHHNVIIEGTWRWGEGRFLKASLGNILKVAPRRLLLPKGKRGTIPRKQAIALGKLGQVAAEDSGREPLDLPSGLPDPVPVPSHPPHPQLTGLQRRQQPVGRALQLPPERQRPL